MIRRLIAALVAAAGLLFFVFFTQSSLSRVCGNLAKEADAVMELLSDQSTQDEGMNRLRALSEDFEKCRPFLGIFVNDGRIHEVQRALSRGQKLGEEGDVSPVLEALADLSRTLKELSETHRPTWENIL